MPDQPTAKFDSPLIQELRGLGYTHLKELPDGCVVGINRLLFTTALHIGLTELSWERRYCYEDPLLAVAALGALKSEDDMPLPGYVAKRGLGA